MTAGVPTDDVLRIPGPSALLQAVRDGQVDCFAFDDISRLREMVRSDGDGVEVAAAFMPAGRLPYIGAYAFQPASAGLVASFDNRLRDLHESGDWLQMVEPFGFTEDNAPPADLTTEKACGGS